MFTVYIPGVEEVKLQYSGDRGFGERVMFGHDTERPA